MMVMPPNLTVNTVPADLVSNTTACYMFMTTIILFVILGCYCETLCPLIHLHLLTANCSSGLNTFMAAAIIMWCTALILLCIAIRGRALYM